MSFNDWFTQWIKKRWYVALFIVFISTATVQFIGDTIAPPFNSGSTLIGLLITWVIIYIIYKTQNQDSDISDDG